MFFLPFNPQLSFGGAPNPPGAPSYPPYSAPGTSGYGPVPNAAAPYPPPIGFNPSVIHGAQARKTNNFLLLFLIQK